MVKRTGIFLALILLSAFLCPAGANASSGKEHLTVILIVDNSGSMGTSDPDNLRFTGVRLFTSLLDAGDAAGLIVFATESQVATNGLETLESENAGSELFKDFHPPMADGYTNVKAAFLSVKELIAALNQQEDKVVIVLLTDGEPEIPNLYPQYKQETLELARSLNVPVLAIALTTDAQTPFLDELAIATNGSVIHANDATDLLEAYLQVLGTIKDRTIMGGDKFETDGSMMVEPALAPYIDAVTFVIAKPEVARTQLLGPDARLSAVNRSSDERYSIFTLVNPAGGKYSFSLQGGGEAQAWAILRSRLRVQIVSPGAIHPLQQDLPIVVNLVEETTDGEFIKIIGDANFTASITAPDGSTMSLDRFYDDSTHGDAVIDDGNYTRLLPNLNLEGIYLISIQGWKGIIPVQAETHVNVRMFPELVVDSPSRKVEIRSNHIELRLHLATGTSFDQGQVIAQITTPSGQVDEIILQGDGAFKAEYIPVEEGRYHVIFETQDVRYLGVDYHINVEHIFDVTIIPFVSVAVSKIEIPTTCLSAPHEVFLTLSILSSDDENLRFSVPSGWHISPESAKVKKGEEELNLRLRTVEEMGEVANRVEVQIEGGDRLAIQPDAVVAVDLQIPSLYARCRTPIQFSVSILFAMVVGFVIVQRARKAVLPPKVSGTLRHWGMSDNAAVVMEIDLTEFGKSTLTIGKGATCDVMVSNVDLEVEHARLFAEKSANGVDIYLEPFGEVRKGYSLQVVRFVLRHGDTFRMGVHEFQYLSDHGE